MKLFSLKVFPATTLALLAALVVGCQSSRKIDWNSRVGNYTYDQAVTELGPPDKHAKLTDGSAVADWVLGRRPSSGLSIGTGVFGRNAGVSVGQSIGGGSRLRVLRLTFDEENRLINWRSN